MDVKRAGELAEHHLADAPRRLAHVRAVAGLAQWLADELQLSAPVLVSAAWLHDVGYAAAISRTGFHPLDGARYLRAAGSDKRVVNLVAHHSLALVEAEERGADRELLTEFPLDPSLPHDALCYCDMTTGPDGQRMTVHERLAEIRVRYGPGDVVTRFIDRAEPQIVASVERVEAQLAAAGAQSR